MQSSCPIVIPSVPNYSAPSIHVLLGDNPFSLVIKASIHVYRLREGSVEVWILTAVWCVFLMTNTLLSIGGTQQNNIHSSMCLLNVM